MAALTLLTRPRVARPVSLAISKPNPRRLEPHTLPARLHEVEERLVSEAMERHPGRERAITHLLRDMEKPAGMTASDGRRTQLADPAHIERVEDLLLEAIIRTHPNRATAIDRLLGDVVGDAAIDDVDIEREAAQVDMTVDNDFDGLG